MIIFIVICLMIYGRGLLRENAAVIDEASLQITKDYLTINRYSRPGIKLSSVQGIVIHYTANPQSTAKENRDYFEGLKDSKEAKVSAHFVIGLKGEIIQCIPTTEMAYCSNKRNKDTLSIECCHKDKSGKFNTKTYNALVKLTKYLMDQYHLDSDQIIRHYDITGKKCPKYFVDHEDEWEEFKNKLS